MSFSKYIFKLGYTWCTFEMSYLVYPIIECKALCCVYLTLYCHRVETIYIINAYVLSCFLNIGCLFLLHIFITKYQSMLKYSV